MQAKDLIRFLKCRMICEYRLEGRDPVAALAGLAIGNAQKARPERGTHGREHVTRIGKRNAADELNGARRHAPSPPEAQSMVLNTVMKRTKPIHCSHRGMACA